MKIVVIGESGLVGRKVAGKLRQRGHEVVAAAPCAGGNAITREGLAAALSNAHAVVDAANAPSFEDKAALEFFEASSANLLAAETAAGIRHHVALSVVGANSLPDSAYMRAKAAQEKLVETSRHSYTIVQATQFFEFIGSIVQSGSDGGVIRLSPVLLQPIASDDVAMALAEIAVGSPVNGSVEVAGPEQFPLDALARLYLAAKGDRRQVIADVHARHFGIELNDKSLTPRTRARLGTIHFGDWLSQNPSKEARTLGAPLR